MNHSCHGDIMLTRLRHWIHSPPLTDPVERRLERPLRYALVAMLVLSILGLPFALTAPRPASVVALLSLASVGLTCACIAALVLLRHGQLHRSVLVVACAVLGVITVNLAQTGLANSEGLLLALALPIVLIGLIGRRRSLLLIGMLTLTTFGIGAAFELAMPLNSTQTIVQRQRLILVTGFSTTLVTITLMLFLDRFSTALREALTALHDANARLERELSERRRVEESLREREELFRLITENLTDLVCTLDADMRFTYVGPAFQRLLGYDAASLVGTNALSRVHPEDQAHVLERWQQISDVNAPQATFRYRHAQTGEWRWFDATGKPVTLRGTLLAVIVGRDVTAQRGLEAQLIQAQKMEGIGRLAGGVAHDFNNLLVAISGYATMAAESIPGDHPASDDLREIRKAADRAADLTRQLLAFARRQRSDPQIISLNDLLADMDRLLRRLIQENITLVTNTDPDLWSVRADVSHIEQVLINLVVNSRDAMPHGGELTITTANVMLDDAFVRQHPSVIPGPHVMIAVADTGVGMDAETMRRLFEPFFTTKPPGIGTGLGLATCYGIVKQHGGSIWPKSEPGRGATFRVYLPRATGVPLSLPPRVSRPGMPRGHEALLLVEDDAAVRELVARVLRNQGYTVLEANDGEEALQMSHTEVALLLTDVIMPRLGGQELARQLMRTVPTLRVLYISGYADTDQPLVEGAFLQKPFTPEELARRVREVLDGEGL
jgi:PAS domain S-box-containing protein